MDIFIHRTVKPLTMLAQGVLITALLALNGCVQYQKPSTLLLGGDVFLARGGELIFSVKDDPWGEFLPVRQEFPQGFFAVNLESPMGTMKQNTDPDGILMNLCAPVDAVHLLKKAEVNLAIMANNHAKDCVDGGEQSASILNDSDIAYAGEHDEVLIQKISGRTAAFIALNDYSGSYDLATILSKLKIADKTSDLVVVSVHWGQEYQVNPTDHQKELARQLVDAGADVVWGHHPHVLQPMQWMDSAVDGHSALVVYSLGNLLSDQWMMSDTQRGVVPVIQFDQRGIRKVIIIPIKMNFASEKLQLVKTVDEVDSLKNRIKFDELKNGKIGVEMFLPK